jgi:hypothetical protein
MKIYKITLLFLLLTTFSCSKEEANTSKGDFTLLGLEKIRIDDDIIGIGSNGFLLDLGENEQVVLSDFSYGVKKAVCEYACFVSAKDMPFVSFESKYDDILINKREFQISDYNAYEITVSKAGCAEEITYVIVFMSES